MVEAADIARRGADSERAARGGGLEHRVRLRLLSCAAEIEARLRRRLRERFGITPARFDLMAHLDAAPEGLALGELARRMVVTNGNVTGLAARLAAEGLVERAAAPGDRRSTHARLTPAGRARFAEIAEAHRGWVSELFGEAGSETLARLYADLGALRAAAEGRDA